MKIIIKIQSVTDVITNSSSELFCTIVSENFIDSIYELLEDEILKTYLSYCSESDLSIRYEEGEGSMTIDIPYSKEHLSTFYKAGIVAILDEKFGKSNYEIKFENLK